MQVAMSRCDRLSYLVSIGKGTLLFPFLRTEEGRACAATSPTNDARTWKWPIPRHWGAEGQSLWQLRYPLGIAISPSGHLVVCDSYNTRIVVYTLDGTFVTMWGGNDDELGHVPFQGFVAISPIGMVYISDSQNDCIRVFRMDGTFIRKWGSFGDELGQFSYPTGIAIHKDTVMVSDRYNFRIQCFQLDGTFLRWWRTSTDPFSSIEGIAVVEDEVFVCDSYHHCIYVYRMDGVLLRSWGRGHMFHPKYITISYAGEIIISDDRSVKVWTSQGEWIRDVSRPPYLSNKIYKPRGVAVTSDRDIIIADFSNHRLYVEAALFFVDANREGNV